jgi:hypothetical protein
MKNHEESKTARRLNRLFAITNRIKGLLRNVNFKMEGKYSPSRLALIVTVITALVASIILFLPNYLGVAGDGSTDEVMRSAGIYYLDKEPDKIYNNYFVKTYSTIASGEDKPGKTINSQVFFICLAKALDDLVTRDHNFDIRFLGLIYLIFYLPAVYLIVRQMCQRVKQFTEGFVIAGAGLIIFSDIGYITYFNSFYPEAIWLIAMLYCTGAAMSFQKERPEYLDFLGLMLFLTSAMILTGTRRQCGILGFLFAIYVIRLIFVRRNFLWGISCMGAAFVLSLFAYFCMFLYPSDFSETSKFHSMTRGVLFVSSDPAKTLGEFGIDPSYELLTDASSYDYLPLVKSGDASLYHGFMDQFTTSDIAVYYLRHPGSMLGMIDVSIGAGMDIRRGSCGNYEMSAGMPEKAKSIFWSGWSTFKAMSAPRTIGYLFLLTGFVFFLFYKGYSIRPQKNRRNTILLDMNLTVLGVLLSQSVVVIIGSGDAEMVQRMFLVGLSLDIMTYSVFAELQHKLKIV